MALMSAYLIATKNAPDFFAALKIAKAPERFTLKFLKDLDFASSNDRLFIGVLKGLGFIDENGAPTSRYFEYLDDERSGRVLAEAIVEAYGDLFALNTGAQKLDIEVIKGKFKSLTQGQKSENVIGLMAKTFKVLSDMADWSGPTRTEVRQAMEPTKPAESADAPPTGSAKPFGMPVGLHYNIQIILPESRDQSVYDALFASLRKHLF